MFLDLRVDGVSFSGLLPQSQLPPERDSTMETRVYLRRQCLLSEPNVAPEPEFLGALAAIFLPLLIGKAIGGVSAALKKAGAEKTVKDSGRLPTYLYQLSNPNTLSLNPDLGCVIVVRGTFSGPDNDRTPEIIFKTNGVFLDPDDERRRIRLNDNGIPVTEIAAVYEARIVTSQDGTALYYESRFLEVNEFQDGGKQRSLVVSVALFGAGAKEGDPTLSLALMNLGEIRRGTVLGPAQLKSKRSTWLGGLGISDASMEAAKKIKAPGANDPPVGIMPVTIEGGLAETEKANDALLFIAEILDATKETVSKAIADEILKDPTKAVTEAADALEKLRQEEEAAYSAYLTAKSALAQMGEPPAPPTAADTAKREAAVFDVTKAKRAWCLKFDAVKKFGLVVVRADTCP
ncbi:MAG: hypothetical protein QOF62_3383 [Pyrinomonadaceae bacterium]|jgi:hypothetical protein|nr:hypothetical protein [Pyrinomonadaceae bacterium]